MNKREYSTKNIDRIIKNDKDKTPIVANKQAVLAALTDEQKQVAMAYLSDVSSNKRKAIEFAQNARIGRDYNVYNDKSFSDIVYQMVQDGEISEEKLEYYTTIDYDALEEDLKNEYAAVYEDGRDTIIIY